MSQANDMSTSKRTRGLCKNVAEVFQLTIQSQTRALAKSQKEAATRESVRAIMRSDCNTLGISDLDNDLPAIVHIAGTKGKGSTCALLESALRHSDLKTGIFTSPHLVDVRERIRVNGRLLPKEIFDRHVMDTYTLLGSDRMETIGFFQFMTLTMLRIFARTTPDHYAVDVVILETGIGGRLDFTNAFDRPLCCAITKLDYDHMDMLGHTLALIAREKAGIIKTGVKVFTPSTQAEEGLPVIVNACRTMASPLEIVPPMSEGAVELGIEGAPQQENGALATAMAKHVLYNLRPGSKIDQKKIDDGLHHCKFPGRAQVEKSSDGLAFYLDGAHTPLSVECAARWYRKKVDVSASKSLIFHCSPDRDGKGLLSTIKAILPELREAYFMAPSSGLQAGGPSYHEQLALFWRSLDPENVASTPKDGPQEFKSTLMKRRADGLSSVFVVGSFYIVGDALKFWIDRWNVENAFTHE